MNHYVWLDKNFFQFLINLGYPKKVDQNVGIITAHGDKCYSHKDIWANEGIEFHHGVALYLLMHIDPWYYECRNVGNEFISPHQWVIDNYNRFKDFLPKN